MLSLPDGWAFSIEGLVKMSLDGKSSVMSALNELEDAGYLYREQIKKDGRYAGMEYIVSEVRMTDFPNSEARK
jgi:predicted transcriptional regulator